MKRLFTCAAIVAVLASSTSAFAAVDTIYGTDPELDQACDDLLNPSDKSGYTTFAIDISNTSDSTVTEDIGGPTYAGIGTPTTSWVFINGSAHVNGQSVNIFANGNSTVTYPLGATATYQTKTTHTITRSGTCHVHKPTEGNDNDGLHPGYTTAPPGLQPTDPVTATEETVTYGTRTVNIPGPWVDPNASVTGGQVVICISPGKVPGTWRGQNGYTNQLGRTCSTTWYNELGSTPSVSVPAV